MLQKTLRLVVLYPWHITQEFGHWSLDFEKKHPEVKNNSRFSRWSFAVLGYAVNALLILGWLANIYDGSLFELDKFLQVATGTAIIFVIMHATAFILSALLRFAAKIL